MDNNGNLPERRQQGERRKSIATNEDIVLIVLTLVAIVLFGALIGYDFGWSMGH